MAVRTSVTGVLPFGEWRARVTNTVDAEAPANVTARAAVVVVILKKGTSRTENRRHMRAIDLASATRIWTTDPVNANGRRVRTHVPAGAAVVEVIGQIGACPIAIEGAHDAGVLTLAGNAGGCLVWTRLAGVPAASAVVDVVGRAGVAALAGATEPGGVVVAIPAGRQTGILLRLVATPTEGFARIVPRGTPGGPQPQLAEHRSGEDGPHPPQRFAAGNGSGQ